ncbi:MAG TPA: LON peptidase substrate-binding domain-containing protein [Jatrophihabitans sp.]|nr:LON peptidase substrate-binding domain-containing protein [Jatrophihabitans sp.]
MSSPGASRAEQLPLFPLSSVLTPGMPLALHVFEPRYRQLVADLLNDQDPRAPEFGVVALRAGWEVGELQDLHQVGTTARVTDVLPLPDGRCDLSAVGERRFAIEELDAAARPYLLAKVRWLPELDGDISDGLVASTRRALGRHRDALLELGVDYLESDGEPVAAGPREFSYSVARQPWLPLADRQQLLACADTAGRLHAARAVLRREAELVAQLHAVPVSAAAFRTP